MSDNRTVFLVTSGDYSDYRVVCVCSTRERAEAVKLAYEARYAKENGQPQYGRDVDIDERPLDAEPPLPPGAFKAFARRDGTVTAVSWYDGADPHQPAAHTADRSEFVGYGQTREHARRSAEELRRAVLAGTVVRGPEAI